MEWAVIMSLLIVCSTCTKYQGMQWFKYGMWVTLENPGFFIYIHVVIFKDNVKTSCYIPISVETHTDEPDQIILSSAILALE